MGMKTSTHVIRGMNRDLSKSKISSEYAFDAQNIRITAREGNTLLSVTNEKGNTPLGISFEGKVIGYCVVNTYLVVFSTNDSLDFIYRIDKHLNVTSLYTGNLGFSEEHPIEAIGVYENENIQKVYWVDGINQPRVINIVKDALIGGTPVYNDNSFDFVQELSLKEKVEVERVLISNGMFSPGTIQYAFTYYTKYGQESNIFYTTELFNLSHNDRGGSPEDKINNSFTINISNIDNKFDYIRVYSIHRTSLDAIPVVKRISDIEISGGTFRGVNSASVVYRRTNNPIYVKQGDSNNEGTLLSTDNFTLVDYTGTFIENTKCFKFTKDEYPELILDFGNGIATWEANTVFYISETGDVGGPGGESAGPIIIGDGDQFLSATRGKYDNGATIVDNGVIGSDIDPTQLLYIGGESVIANTITQKDQTLFLGNIELTRKPIDGAIKSSLYAGEGVKNSNTVEGLTNTSRTVNLGDDGIGGFYIYRSSLAFNTAGFKVGEYYRIGIQFQHKTGKWSEPILIGDIKYTGARPNLDNGVVTIPTMAYTLAKDIATQLNSQYGYKRARAVVVFPTLQDRSILLQGMLCPTVFRAGSRKNNTPFSQASWFIRPNLPWDVGTTTDDTNNNKKIEKGAWVEFRHLHSLKSKYDRGAEIQNIGTSPYFVSVNNAILQGSNDSYDNTFFIDQSVLTMHSPEIEFDPSIATVDNSNVKMRIVGLINFTASVGDIDIQTSTPPIHYESSGFIHNTTSVVNASTDAARGLVAGLFYKDYFVDDAKNASRYEPYPKQTYEHSYMVYPWHRSGSLNNDAVRPSDKGTRSAVLKKKVISNMKFSKYNTWLSSSWAPTNGITAVQLFNSNEVSLVKMPIPDNSSIDNMNYYGNIDTLLTSTMDYGIVYSKGNGYSSSFYDVDTITDSSTVSNIGDYDGLLKKTKEPVRMRYKSGPHLVFGINYDSAANQVILPTVGSINGIDIGAVPFWSKKVSGSIDSSAYTKVKYYTTYPPSYSYSDISVGDLWIDPSGRHGANIGRGAVLWRYTGYNRETDEFGNIAWEMVSLGDGDKCKYESYNRTYYYSASYNGSYFALFEDDISSGVYEGVQQSNISANASYPYLFLAELYRDLEDMPNIFGGNTEDAIKENLWVPAGNPVDLDSDTVTVKYDFGDTWYQRYDCLKTYPFSMEDENQVVEIASFMCETRVNIDGRYDRNRGQSSNLNMSPINFNLFNPVYSQRDNFFNYRILDKDYYTLNKFPNTITWSKKKTLAEEVDTWANVTMANTLDLDGSKGKVNALRTFNNEIYCFQDTGISNILFNSRVQIPASDGVPIEISNGYKVDGKRYLSSTIGCKNRLSIAESSRGLYFADSDSSSLYLLSEGLTNLSAQFGFEQWSMENLNDSFFRTFYDKNYGDVYFTTSDTSLCYSERLNAFTSFLSYGKTPYMFNIGDEFYAIAGEGGGPDYPKLWKQFDGVYNKFFGSIRPYSITVVCNQDEPYDKIFDNIEFRADTWDGSTLLSTTFDTLEVENEYQKGVSTLTNTKDRPSSLKRKFRVWRANIPRANTSVNGVPANGRDRIRNTWASIKLAMNNPETYKTELHDLMVHYFI